MDSYKPDAICRILGLNGFVDDGDFTRATAAIRLLMCPSFHMEVCITVMELPKGSSISVVAAQKQIWTYRDPGLVRAVRADAVSDGQFQNLVDQFYAAKSAPEREEGVFDGMTVHLALWSQGESQILCGNPDATSALAVIVGEVVNRAFSSIEDPICRNALGEAARYVSW